LRPRLEVIDDQRRLLLAVDVEQAVWLESCTPPITTLLDP
jgi:hypothetical protein